MILGIEKIREISKGVVRVEETEKGISFFRFTEEQQELYKETNADFYSKSFATAGVRLEFYTDSTSLAMEIETTSASSRKWAMCDITVNGKLIGNIGSSETNIGTYFEKFDLGTGKKKVKIYFPYTAATWLKRFELDDGAQVIPYESKCRMLMYGDSITHGYDAAMTSSSYASLLADALDANAINKGIGGERFFPALAALSDDVDPDYITVAYGTNDWSGATKENFDKNCAEFYKTLSQRNPRAKIFAITPIWRGDIEKREPTKVGYFSYVSEYIKKVTADLPNVTVIDAIDFVPKSEEFFKDLYLHPNADGFAHYFENLYKEIKKYI